ncbi:GNAT family N-acetyltransferase [Kineosporia sp. NBRC 101731]|uniref:GNAT family N-acetyltransferase n=1 Tax=Kineosporia sp. NBRC 101731 TaxID=3032199 RepID=UPI0024A3230C|nr:GNAT family N-acetyltransferase [Kineosporia sp. NBRC 101731]GLY29233.1 N-acetyltransferase [Kineosporia sp. NBRC 101731]
MAWRTAESLPAVVRAAGGLWAADRARHTLFLSLSSRALEPDGPAHTGGWWQEPGGVVTGSYLLTTIRTLILGSLPPGAARPLAVELADRGAPVQAVQGPRATVEEFTATWEARTDRQRAGEMAQKLFRLEQLIKPYPWPTGSARTATAPDRGLLLDWFRAFGEETGAVVDLPASVDDRIATGSLTLWEVDGHPVSLAGTTVPTGGASRVTSVYTPPSLRGKGYAAGAVTASIRRTISAGATTVVLFTDLANPTSNALYRRLGFEPETDFLQITYVR